MYFAIMRCKKHNSMGTVAASMKHCFRERDTANADPERTPDNEHLAASSVDEAMGRLRSMLPAKHRKDAVRAVEYLMTASPGWWKQTTPEEQARFFKESKEWLERKYGADRVLVATIHRDETSPHLSAFVIPLTQDGRLSAKEFIGNREQMSRDQTSFADAVTAPHLQRGIQGSKAHHTTISAYYARMRKETEKVASVDVPDPTLAERFKPRLYGERVAESVLKQIAPAWNADKAKAAQLPDLKSRVTALEYRVRGAELTASTASHKIREAERKTEAAQAIVDLFSSREIAHAKAREEDYQRTMKERYGRAQSLSDGRDLRSEAEAVFASRAQSALRRVDHHYSGVNWREVEEEAMEIAIAQRGETANSVIEAFMRRSPIRLNDEEAKEMKEKVAKAAPDLRAEYKEKQNRREQDRGLER